MSGKQVIGNRETKVPQIFDNSETICYNAVGLDTGNLFYIAQNCLVEKIPKVKLILE